MLKKLRHWLIYPESPLKLALVLNIPLIAVIILLSVLVIYWQKKGVEEIQISNMKLYGKAFAEHILRSDIWQKEHNGYFIEISQHFTRRESLLNIMGMTFARVDPAFYSTRIDMLTRTRSVYRFHITSIESLGTRNSPDRWELDALTRFSQGISSEKASLAEFGPRLYFRYMIPLELNSECRQCHKALNGGLTVEIPVDQSYRIYAGQIKRSSLTFATFGFVIVAFVMVVTYYLSRRISEGFRTVQKLNAKLSALSARNEKLLESIVDGIVVLSPEGKVVMTNDAFKELTGIDEDINGRTIEELNEIDTIREILSCEDRKEISINEKNILVRKLNVSDSGTNYGTMYILHDASKEYLTAAVELGGSAAHEMRQPLSILLNLMEVLKNKVQNGEDPSEVLDYMTEQCRRINSIIDKMLSITRYQRLQYTEETKILDLDTSSRNPEE